MVKSLEVKHEAFLQFLSYHLVYIISESMQKYKQEREKLSSILVVHVRT